MFLPFNQRFHQYLILLAVTGGLFLPALGEPSLWDIDEGHNAEAAREMLERGDWVIPQFNYQLRSDKPILLYWLQIAAYLVFGVGEFAARLPSALAAMVAVLLTCELGRRMFDPVAGLIAGLILATSLLFAGSAHFANPDALLIASTVLTFLLFWSSHDRGGSAWLVWIGLSTGLGFLAKGPVAVVLPAAAIGLFLLWTGQFRAMLRPLLSTRGAVGFLIFAMIVLPWFVLVGSETKGEFLRGFFLRHNKDRFLSPMEGHSGPLFYHVFSLFLGFLPWSIFLPAAIWFARRSLRTARGCGDCSEAPEQSIRAETDLPPHPQPLYSGGERSDLGTTPADSIRFLVCWIAVWFGFFSISQTKLPNYLLPLYPAVALLTAHFLERWRQGAIALPGWVMPAALVGLGLTGVGLAVGVTIAGGKIAIPGLKVHTLPGLEQCAWLGLLPIAGAAAAWCFRRSPTRLLGCIMASAVLWILGLAVAGSLAVDAHKAPRILVETSGTRQLDRDIRIACYEWYQPSLVFYCQREVARLFEESQAVDFLQAPVPVYLFLPADVWDRLPSSASGKSRLLARHRCLYSNREIVVVTNE
jgi:4-amino-4-deoxy-L-arabinose transferase-like glycosyltransferase